MPVFKTYRDYIEHVVRQVGSDVSVAKFLGFSDGSRVGLWRRGDGRPDELNVIKIATWMGDDPIASLHLAGYTEMASLLRGKTSVAPVQFAVLRPHLVALMSTLEGMAKAMDSLEGKKG